VIAIGCGLAVEKLTEAEKCLVHFAETQGTQKQFRFAESVTLMTAEFEGAKASQGTRNQTIFVI